MLYTPIINNKTMFRQFILLGILLLAVGNLNGQNQDETFLKYIERNKDLALREMERAGVPASIKLAQGLLESNAGRSFLAKKGNNHFGIKCGDNWKGRKVYRKDDEYDSKGRLVESCFRSYRSVEACYIAHSEFLRGSPKTVSLWVFYSDLIPWITKGGPRA
jgi:flagellum-specific peptidoglycan hydrolase FlgJ